MLFYLFIFGCVGSSFLCEGFLQLRQAGATLHRGVRASHYRGLSRCGAQAPDAQAQQLWLTGPDAPRHVGSPQTRARTRVPCTGRQTLNHCATREAPCPLFFKPEVLHKTVESRVALAEPFHGLFLVPWGNQVSPETQSGNFSPSPFLPWYPTCPFHREAVCVSPASPISSPGEAQACHRPSSGVACREPTLLCDTSAPQHWIAPQAFIKP